MPFTSSIMVRTLATFLFLFCLILPLTSQKLVFTPQWTPQSQFAGYYVAQEKGFYKEAGLDVVIVHPSTSNNCINRLLKGTSQIISMPLIQAMTTIDSGTPLVNILQTSQTNALMIVAHNHIRSLKDLAGKKVGRWKVGFCELGDILDKDHHLQMQWVPFIQNINLFISEAIDATIAMSYNEYFQILASGVRIKPENIFYFSKLGYNIPEDGLYVTESFYHAHRQEIQKFAKASQRGWEWAAKHPEETLEIVMCQAKLHNIVTNRENQKWMLREVLRLQHDKNSNKATFHLCPESLRLANDLLTRYGIIKKRISYQQIIQP